jgi:hypothetical protein
MSANKEKLEEENGMYQEVAFDTGRTESLRDTDLTDMSITQDRFNNSDMKNLYQPSPSKSLDKEGKEHY